MKGYDRFRNIMHKHDTSDMESEMFVFHPQMVVLKIFTFRYASFKGTGRAVMAKVEMPPNPMCICIYVCII
jgi:hypothetical protein